MAKIEAQFNHSIYQSAWAASNFGLYAMAGELISKLAWYLEIQGAGLQACQVFFNQWRRERGKGRKDGTDS